MPLSSEARYRCVLLREQGLSYSNVAKQIKCTKSSVISVCKKFSETGDVKDFPRSGRPRSGRTPRNIAACRREVRKGEASRSRSPRRSPRLLAASLNISHSTVRRILHDDLHLKPLKLVRVQQLSDADKRKRLDRCAQILRFVPARNVDRVLFTDETELPLSGYQSAQNMRVYARSRTALGKRGLLETPKFPKKLIVWAGISKTGKTSLKVFPPGQRIDGDTYREMLKNFALPECQQLFGDHPWLFTQDSAPAHRAAETQRFCLESFPRFLRSDSWPPNSPDTNPLDYCVWSYFKQVLYSRHFRNLQELSNAAQKVWWNIPQTVIDSAIDQWRLRLQTVVQSKGAHIVHKFT